MEKLLKINIQDNLFNWIGQEIVFAKFRPDETTRMEDVVVAIHAKDIQQAKDGFGHILQQVQRRLPIKYKTLNYKNYDIFYLDVKGFFKVFLGKLFDKLEKPYIAYIEDYVVMSNSLPTLQKEIDDYLMGQTLSRDEKFMSFHDNFSNKSNISMFIQMPKLYTNLYQFSSTDDKKSIHDNKDLILSFARIGMQFTANDGMFQNYILADHDTAAMNDDNLELMIDSTSENSSIYDINSIDILHDINDSLILANGPYKLYYDEANTCLKFEAMVVSEKLNGMSKLYYESGKLMANLNFKNNLLEGECTFYYEDANSTKKLTADYKNGLINGTCREFYENGAQKSVIKFEKGKPEGDARYFYPTGSIKMEGEFKDSLKTGRWKFYDEKGKLQSKKRFRKGE
jgi:antitoxin component YwqK of YwqJK toxin-antitoxin module